MTGSTGGNILGVIGAAVGGYFGGAQGAQYGWTVGSAVGSAIDPPVVSGPKLGDAAVQTSRDGIPIPIIWGVHHVVGNIIQMNPINEITVKSGSKKTGKVKETRRLRTFAIGIGRGIEGPITGIYRVWENNKLVYDVRTGSSFPAADNTAFEAATNIYLGDEEQLPDSELEAETGVGLTPAYRGLAYCVWVNKDITDFGSAIPNYRFEIGVGAWSPGSSEFSATVGIAATQDEFLDGPDFTHPFEGMLFTKFTMAFVCKLKVMPGIDDSNHQVPFTLKQVGGGIGCKIRNDGSGGLKWIGSGRGTEPNIFVGDVNMTSGSPGFDWDAWHWVGISWTAAGGGAGSMAVRNIETGGEWFDPSFSAKSDTMDFNADLSGSPDSVMSYGFSRFSVAPSELWQAWKGFLSQIWIDGSYTNFSIEANRNKFSALDGTIGYGNQGQRPTGSQPLVYMPYGHPSVNWGSLYLGDWQDDFYVAEYLAGELPPIGTPP